MWHFQKDTSLTYCSCQKGKAYILSWENLKQTHAEKQYVLFNVNSHERQRKTEELLQIEGDKGGMRSEYNKWSWPGQAVSIENTIETIDEILKWSGD